MIHQLTVAWNLTLEQCKSRCSYFPNRQKKENAKWPWSILTTFRAWNLPEIQRQGSGWKSLSIPGNWGKLMCSVIQNPLPHSSFCGNINAKRQTLKIWTQLQFMCCRCKDENTAILEELVELRQKVRSLSMMKVRLTLTVLCVSPFCTLQKLPVIADFCCRKQICWAFRHTPVLFWICEWPKHHSEFRPFCRNWRKSSRTWKRRKWSSFWATKRKMYVYPTSLQLHTHWRARSEPQLAWHTPRKR